MPELPEVETTRRGIAPQLAGRHVTAVHVRERRLRRPVPATLARELPGQRIESLTRRGKYLLLNAPTGAVVVHLGMSGCLRILTRAVPPGPHDHVDIVFEGGIVLRLRDPRRFGLVLWTRGDPLQHELLRDLGPEPLAEGFGGSLLYARSRGRRVPVKGFLMDSRIVVGIGNIYANEALACAGVHPLRAAGRISAARYEILAACIREVLGAALEAGGTTLRDFRDGSGRPGYFAVSLGVYGRTGEPCPRCGAPIRCVRQAQRSTWYCPRCQR